MIPNPQPAENGDSLLPPFFTDFITRLNNLLHIPVQCTNCDFGLFTYERVKPTWFLEDEVCPNCGCKTLISKIKQR